MDFIAILKDMFRLVFGGCPEHGQFTGTCLSRQRVSLFELGQFPSSLVGGIMRLTLQASIVSHNFHYYEAG